MPDVPPQAALGLGDRADSLARPGEIVGLLEYLDARGGKMEISQIAGDIRRELGLMISVVTAAEQLGFVDTPKRLVVLSPAGQQFVKAPMPDRQRLWHTPVAIGPVPRHSYRVERQGAEGIDRDFVLDVIVLHLPQEDFEKMFTTLVRWARFGHLWDYDEYSQRFTLPDSR